MNHGICFFRSLQCGIFYVVSFFSVLLLLAHLSLFGTPKTNGNFKIFRVKTTTNGQMIFIHGNASFSLSFFRFVVVEIGFLFGCQMGTSCNLSLAPQHTFTLSQPRVHSQILLLYLHSLRIHVCIKRSMVVRSYELHANNDALTENKKNTFKFALIVSKEKTKS